MKAGLIGQLNGISANIAGGPMYKYTLTSGHARIIKSICHAVTLTTGADAAWTKFRVFGFRVIILAEVSAYSAYAPVNCSLVAPYSSSPCLNPATPAPTVSTTPDSSEPRISGKCSWMPLLPSRMSASQGPTPAAYTRIRSCPSAGSGGGNSSYSITLGGPNCRTRAAFICPPKYL